MGRYRGVAGMRPGGRYSFVSVLTSCAACFVLGYLLRGLHLLTPPSESQSSRPLALQQRQAFTDTLRDDGAGLGGATSALPGNDELKRILADIAINKEVLATVSNRNLISDDGQSGMLKLWIDGARQANVTNMMVIAVDDEVPKSMEKLGVPCWRARPAPVADKAENGHAVSSLKFQLVRDFLVLGYSILLSDVDILVVRNPFDHLYRDRDIEGQSDGYDPPTAYGYDDVFRDKSMGWAQYAHTMRIFTLNSGLFYTRPNVRTVNLMERITARLMKAMEWDQAVYNEEIFFPTHGDFDGTHITVRVMDIYDFANTKVLFKTIRYESRFADHIPVTVHANYHPDKLERLQAVWKRYVENDVHALDHQPIGSCPNDECPPEE
ncbi:hypothetical protein BSKO_08397 [Bryopsis sp. KO-2023]|nr:hypothetical protein BSKO_08397 [Bryopsis sp. KO-2023]